MKELFITLGEVFINNGKMFTVVFIASLVMLTIVEEISKKFYGVKIINAVKKYPYCRGCWFFLWIKSVLYVIYVICVIAVLLNGVELFFRADAIEHGYYI